MKSTKPLQKMALLSIFIILLANCGGGGSDGKKVLSDISMESYTNSIFQIIKAHRTSYAKLIINRLVNEEQVIKANEQWQDNKALLLPAQMFRETATILQESGSNISFSLLSLWPINKQNSPQTEAEKNGLEFVKANPGKNYYEKEKLGKKDYFTAVYPDNAVSKACVSCHNNHKDSPKKDFKLGDNMGGIIIRIPVDGDGSSGINMENYVNSASQVIKAHRTSYAKLIINRLVNEEKVIKASEQWQDNKALLLPAQMFRETAIILQESGSDISFSLLSLWPINKQNAAQTDAEKKGLEFIKTNPGKNYYEQEKLGPKTYFTSVYPDNAVSMACVTCHNGHKDSPKKNFKMNDNMGGVVIRIPVKT
jgi:hypothetical protein